MPEGEKTSIAVVIHGEPVLRTYLHVPTRPGKALNRILFDTSFAVSAFLGGLAAGRCNLIVVVSPPLQAGLSGWLWAAGDGWSAACCSTSRSPAYRSSSRTGTRR